MKIIELTTNEQLESLKKGDLLIVEWEYHPVTGHEFKEIIATKIWGINDTREVIVRKKDNLYFSIDMFLLKESCAKRAYLVLREEELK
jgi:hypothetical protein